MMQKIILIVSMLLLMTGCAGKQVMSTSDKTESSNFPSSKYLTATGIGQSDSEARRQAVAELSNIFESKVFNDTYTHAKLVMDSAKGESVNRRIESNIRVVSSVRLEGVRIGKTWQKGSEYYALAVLDRLKAREKWSGEIEKIDTKIEAELKALDTLQSKVLKLMPLNRILKLWIEKEILISRLRVIGFTDVNFAEYDIKSVIEMIPAIKATIRIYVEITGSHAGDVANQVARTLNNEGFIFSNSKADADALITGKVKIEPVNLNRQDFKFARAKVALSIIDSQTGSQIGAIVENTRAGHMNFDEAAHKAVKKVSTVVSEKLVEYFAQAN